MNFPSFDGTDLRLWITCAEDYFQMYSVDPTVWIQCSRMQFTGPAKRWIQSVTPQLKNMQWSAFCRALHTRFDRDQHEFLLRQLNRIRQNSSVQDYVDRFSELVDQLNAYDSTTNMLHYITRFVDGLYPEIRAVLLVQRPNSLDTAYTLALLQEEAADPPRRRDFKRGDGGFALRWNAKGAPLQPLPEPDKALTMQAGAERPGYGHKPIDRKLADLKAFRRARGLCDHCGEKWSRDHKCAAQVGLHVLEEIYALFTDDDTVDSPALEDDEEQLCLCLAADASGNALIDGVKTLQFQGQFQNQSILILLDSGSSSSFISKHLVQQLSVPQVQCKTLSVRVANGDIMSCSTYIPAAVWTMDQYQFQHNLKVLPLTTYDVILGMDWLQLFSPMKVDWKNHWLAIPYHGATVRLQGLSSSGSDSDAELLVQVFGLSSVHHECSNDIPSDIQQLLSEFPQLTKPPTELPPQRHCDHAIPLIEGAQPINVRPYHYPPALKDEIEAQVDAMLQQGIIQPSTSPFNSPVLLVRKKDKTWRFCVDYRYLNALTVRTAFPIPVFEQLMDELAGAHWFSTLDLLSGYHQIRMRPGEEYKTAFSTHVGHYEFRVVAFGLSGAPGTFQGAMNTTLKPLLRRCAIVFFDDILIYSGTLEEHLEHLRQVFSLLAQDQWHIKLSKCKFAQTEISYLGHVISAQGVATDPSKVADILSWPQPSNVKELRSFLGLSGFYRRFVRHYAIISKPLTSLLKKHSLFIWTSDHTIAFNTLKECLSSAPILALPDFKQQFCIETDASNFGVGAVLLQNGHPLAFLSRALGPKNQGLSAYEKEYMAILIAVEQCAHTCNLVSFSYSRIKRA
jgi:hypothetical protein